MIRQEQLFLKLTLLKVTGQLPKSQCGSSFLHLLRPLLTADVVAEQRSGTGRKLIVKDRATLQAFIDKSFRDGEASDQREPRRVVGVRRFRDSKALANDTPETIQIRAWTADVLQKDSDSIRADVETKSHSVFSFQLGTAYTLHGRCALVEGPALFRLFERLSLKIPLVIYGQGRASKVLVEWLAQQSAPTFSLLHIPDYDPVGLNEFERLRSALESRVSLYLPANLDDLFLRYSKPELVQKRKSQMLLARLRRSDSSEIQSVVSLIDKHNAGLEQEALLIDQSTGQV